MLGKFATTVTETVAGVAGIGAALAGAFAATTVTGIGLAWRNIAKINQEARKLGVGVNEFRAFLDAADKVGISGQTVGQAFQRAGRRIGEAVKGKGEAVGALAELGLNPSILAAKSFEQQMIAVGEQLLKIENINRRNAVAMKIFDSEGVVLTNMFQRLAEEGEKNMGRKGVAGGFERFREQIRRTGRDLDARADKVETLLGRFATFGDVIEGVFTRLSLRVAPVFDNLLRRLEAFVTRGDVQNALAAGARQLANWINQAINAGNDFLKQRSTWKEFGDIVKNTRELFGEISSTINTITNSVGSWIEAIKTLWAWQQRLLNNLKMIAKAFLDFWKNIGRIGQITLPAAGRGVAGNFAPAVGALREGNLLEAWLKGVIGSGKTVGGALGILSGRNQVANLAGSAAKASASGLIEDVSIAGKDIVEMGKETGQAVARALSNNKQMIIEVVGN